MVPALNLKIRIYQSDLIRIHNPWACFLHKNLYTVAFLYVRYGTVSCWFLFISFVVRDVGGEGGSAVRKTYCTGPCKLATIPLYNPLKPPVGAHVHKLPWLIGPVRNAFDAGKSFIWASGRGWALEILTFLDPKWHSPGGFIAISQGPKKSWFPGPQPLPLALVMDCPHQKHYVRVNRRSVNSCKMFNHRSINS